MHSVPVLATLGPVAQLAYVTNDMDDALRYWTGTMGVGPFFVRERVRLPRVLYRGAPTDIEFDMAIAYWGDTQIELIKQHNDAPSIYKAWREKGGVGIQHIGVFVDDVQDARRRVTEYGGSIEQEVFMPAGSGEVIYVDMGRPNEPMVEYIQLNPDLLAGFDTLRAASVGWDGSDPVRRR